jgi:hypothetical protein
MAIKTLTYLDLSPEQRRAAAKGARDRLRTLLANPLLTAQQREILGDHLTQLDLWEGGRLPTGLPEIKKQG